MLALVFKCIAGCHLVALGHGMLTEDWVPSCWDSESHHAGTQSPIMLGVTVGGAGVEITSARNVGIEHLYVIYVGSMLAIVFIGLKLL